MASKFACNLFFLYVIFLEFVHTVVEENRNKSKNLHVSFIVVRFLFIF